MSESQSKLTEFLSKNLFRREGDELVEYEFSKEIEPEFYGFYFSAAWCGPCQKYTPKLVKFYNLMKHLGYKNFELIFVSQDHSRKKMKKYVIEKQMKWLVLSFQKRNHARVSRLEGNGIPCLVVTDRQGRILSHSYRAGEYLGPDHAKQSLRELLKYSNLDHLEQVQPES